MKLQFENNEKRDEWINQKFPNRKTTQKAGIYNTQKGKLAIHPETIISPEIEFPDLPLPNGWEYRNTGGNIMCYTYETENEVIYLGNSLGYIGASIVEKDKGYLQLEISLEGNRNQIQSAHRFMRFITQTHQGAN